MSYDFPESPDVSTWGKQIQLFPHFHFNSNNQSNSRNESKQLRPGTFYEWFTKYFPFIICIFFLH